MSDRVFVDTNILIYAHNVDAGEKYRKAAAALEQLWAKDNGVLSTQVLQEFYVTITKKIQAPLSPCEARNLIQHYMVWPVVLNEPAEILTASRIEEENRISFWDALIVASAAKGNATIILTEDLNHGQIIEGIRIDNPLLHD